MVVVRSTKKPDEVKLGTARGGVRRGKPRNGDGRTEPNDPQDGKAGNTKGDQQWLADQVALGLIKDIPEDEEDVPFGALKIWTGDFDDATSFSYWTLPPEGKRCNGKAKVRDEKGRPVLDKDKQILMRPCAKPTIVGGSVCIHHGGGPDRVRKAAQMRLLSAADGLIGALIKIALDEKQDARARVQAINSALDRAGIKGTIDITVEVPKYKEMLAEMFGDWTGGGDGDD